MMVLYLFAFWYMYLTNTTTFATGKAEYITSRKDELWRLQKLHFETCYWPSRRQEQPDQLPADIVDSIIRLRHLLFITRHMQPAVFDLQDRVTIYERLDYS